MKIQINLTNLRNVLTKLDEEFKTYRILKDTSYEEYLSYVFENSESSQRAIKSIYLDICEIRWNNLELYCELYKEHTSIIVIEQFMLHIMTKLIGEGQLAINTLNELFDNIDLSDLM